jgi:hypothetical protein
MTMKLKDRNALNAVHVAANEVSAVAWSAEG